VLRFPHVYEMASFELRNDWVEVHLFEWPRHIDCRNCLSVIKARMQREAIPTIPTQ
jgi:hypothetical protein